MPTNSAFGWPITTKTDMFKPTTISALEGAAFDNRVNLERARHEKRVASSSSLPSSGDYVGQQVWVNNLNKHYYWTGANWKPANGTVAGGTVFISNTKSPWMGNKSPIRWTGEVNVALPSGRFSAVPSIVVNAFAAGKVFWASLSTTPSNTSTFKVRVMCVTPGTWSYRINWVAVQTG